MLTSEKKMLSHEESYVDFEKVAATLGETKNISHIQKTSMRSDLQALDKLFNNSFIVGGSDLAKL